MQRRCSPRSKQIVERTGRACFNHPASVMRSTRDGVATMLQGIKGVVVPRTIRHAFDGEEGLRKAIADAELSYPVIVRIAGDHGGVSTIKVDTPEGLVEARKLNCYGRTVYATEFVDFKSPDGRYRKFRLAVIGGNQIFLRHTLIADDWLLHAEQARQELPSPKKRANARSTSRTDLEPKSARRPCSRSQNGSTSTISGIDCNISEDGTITLFEANACMNILNNSQVSPNMWDGPISKIQRAITVLLASPRQWRHPPKAGPSA